MEISGFSAVVFVSSPWESDRGYGAESLTLRGEVNEVEDGVMPSFEVGDAVLWETACNTLTGTVVMAACSAIDVTSFVVLKDCTYTGSFRGLNGRWNWRWTHNIRDDAPVQSSLPAATFGELRHLHEVAWELRQASAMPHDLGCFEGGDFPGGADTPWAETVVRLAADPAALEEYLAAARADRWAAQALAGSADAGVWNYGGRLGIIPGQPPVPGQTGDEMTVEQAEDYAREVGQPVTAAAIARAAASGLIPGARQVGADWLIPYAGMNSYLDNPAVALGRKGGSATSAAKTEAARANARKGGWQKGRPRKSPPTETE